jgi:hypothetical protein
MDDVKGTDYLIVLFAKKELNLDVIRKRFVEAKGAFPERVAQAVGSDYVPHTNIQYKQSHIRFKGTSINRNAVMGLLLAIVHD